MSICTKDGLSPSGGGTDIYKRVVESDNITGCVLVSRGIRSTRSMVSGVVPVERCMVVRPSVCFTYGTLGCEAFTRG